MLTEAHCCHARKKNLHQHLAITRKASCCFKKTYCYYKKSIYFINRRASCYYEKSISLLQEQHVFIMK